MKTTENLSLDIYSCPEDKKISNSELVNSFSDNFQKIDGFSNDVNTKLEELKTTIHTIHGLHDTKSGEIVKVEDGDEGSIFRKISVAGAYEQLATTGKNMLKIAGKYDTSIAGVNVSVANDGTVTLNGTASITDGVVKNIVLGDASVLSWDTGKRYTLSVWQVSGSASVPAGTGNSFAYSIFSQDHNKHFQGDTTQTNITNYTAIDTASDLSPGIVMLQLWRDGITFNNFKFRLQVELGTKATSYEPYTGGKASPSIDYQQTIEMLKNPVVKISGSDTTKIDRQIVLTMPEEHPYLAMLPDTTHDSIEILDDGTIELVARIWNREFNISDMDNAENYPGWSIPKTDELMKYLGQDSDTALSCICSVGGSYNVNTVGDTIRIYTKPDTFGGLTQPEIIMQYPNVTVDMYGKIETNEVRYPVGKIDPVLVPESTCSIWVEAEMQTEVTVDYPRDINIIIKNIENKLNALG